MRILMGLVFLGVSITGAAQTNNYEEKQATDVVDPINLEPQHSRGDAPSKGKAAVTKAEENALHQYGEKGASTGGTEFTRPKGGSEVVGDRIDMDPTDAPGQNPTAVGPRQKQKLKNTELGANAASTILCQTGNTVVSPTGAVYPFEQTGGNAERIEALESGTTRDGISASRKNGGTIPGTGRVLNIAGGTLKPAQLLGKSGPYYIQTSQADFDADLAGNPNDVGAFVVRDRPNALEICLARGIAGGYAWEVEGGGNGGADAKPAKNSDKDVKK